MIDFRVWILPSMIEIVMSKRWYPVYIYTFIYLFFYRYIYIYVYIFTYIYISWPVINLTEFPWFVFQILDLGTLPRFLGWLYVEPFHEHRQWCELARSYWTSHWDKETCRNKHGQLLVSKDNWLMVSIIFYVSNGCLWNHQVDKHLLGCPRKLGFTDLQMVSIFEEISPPDGITFDPNFQRYIQVHKASIFVEAFRGSFARLFSHENNKNNSSSQSTNL